MKKLLFFAAIAAFGLANVNAQETNFGVKAGADIATLTSKFGDLSVSESETGFYVGAFAELGITENIAFQPELLYVSIEDLNQVAIPLMFKFLVSENLNVMAGPSLGLLLDVEEGFSSLNYGLEAGLGYNLTENLLIEARYNLGMANLIEDAPDNLSLKLSGLFIGIGFRL